MACASVKCSRYHGSIIAVSSGRPHMFTLYHRGRGHEPVTVAGSIRSLVAVNAMSVSFKLLVSVSFPLGCPKIISRFLANANDLFDPAITKHIRNIIEEGELVEEAVCASFAHTAADGKTYQTAYYNLDVIISVGYRVK